MIINLSNKSKRNLSAGLDYRLVHIIMESLKLDYKNDWGIFETKRTREQQATNIKAGTSKTFNSKHIPDDTGIVRAFDIVPWISPWGWSWDGKTVDGGYSAEKEKKSKECFDEVLSKLKEAANKYYPNQISFGTDWKNFPDRPHVEITNGKEI